MSLSGTAIKAAAAPYVGLVAPFWPLIWRAAVAAALVWIGWHYGSRGAERELEQFKTDQATAAAAAVAELRAQVAERETKLVRLENEGAQKLRDLEADFAARPPRVVRVCDAPRRPAVPGVPGAAAGNADHGGGSGQLSGGTGRDIGPGLDRLVFRADWLARKCLNQQDRADALAAAEPVIVR